MLATTHAPHNIFSIYVGNQRNTISLASLAIALFGISNLFLRKSKSTEQRGNKLLREQTLLMIIRLIGIGVLFYCISIAIKSNIDFIDYLNKIHESPYKEQLEEDSVYLKQVSGWYFYAYMNYLFIGLILVIFILLVINIWIPIYSADK